MGASLLPPAIIDPDDPAYLAGFRAAREETFKAALKAVRETKDGFEPGSPERTGLLIAWEELWKLQTGV